MVTQVLSDLQIKQKINRIAFQILENNFEEERIFIAGIAGNGALFAERLIEVLKNNSTINIESLTITVDKKNPISSPVKTSIDTEQLKDGCIILVDDVLNSGKTMQYALVKLLEQPTKRIKTVALVDRRHRRYPIKCNYVGLTLSTTLQDRIEVKVNGDSWSAELV